MKAFREMEEKLMTTAFYKLVSLCFTLSFNVSLNHCSIIDSVMIFRLSSVHSKLMLTQLGEGLERSGKANQ